jgi:hypothetical protein
MHVIVTIKLQDNTRTNAIKLCDAKRIDVGNFQDAAKVLDRILNFIKKIPNSREEHS